MKRVVILLAALLVGAAACVGLYFFGDLQVKPVTSLTEDGTPDFDENADPMAIVFSENDTFYDKDIDVVVKCADENAKLYYTTDGSVPSAESKAYISPIKVASKNSVTATTLKVIAINGNRQSEIITKSYVTGRDVFERFDDGTLVFVLSTDPYNLNDYYYGVAVEGYLRDRYLQSEDYDGGEIPYNAPANWYLSGRESERDMYVEVYDCDGTQLINQAAGGRVVGGYSRANKQKSWRLIARNSYSEGNGKFKYSFFEGAADAYGNLFDRYDRITLRDNANDREFASIRDEVSMELAFQAGFPDTQDTRPAAVFLNGDYYGFAWLHEAYSESYLEATYGGNKDNFWLVDGKEQEVTGDDAAIEAYNHVLELLAEDMTDDAVYNELCELVDIDNLIQYIAIQTYINNEDWPANNFKAWRYNASEGEEITSPYLDGKWRFMLFDAEYAWGLYGSGMKEQTISTLLTGNHMQGASAFLTALVQREDTTKMFVNAICDLMDGAFSPSNVLSVIEDKIAECDKECMYALENGYTSDWANPDTFEESRGQIRTFAENRPKLLTNNIKKQFGFEDEKYSVTVNNPTGAESKLSTRKISESGSLTNSYYTVCDVALTAEMYDGYEFQYWEINGEKYDDISVTLTSAMADENAHIEATLYAKKAEAESGLVITRVYYAGSADEIQLYNPGTEDYSVHNLYLSDDELALDRWSFGSIIVKAGETLTVVCKNNKDTSALMKLQTNFSLKAGETLYLSDSEGNILNSVLLVDTAEDKAIIRKENGCYAIADK